MYIADIHTHTIASGHAYGTIREMVRAASDKELAVLGITEHGPGIPGTVDTFYYNNLRVIPKEIYGVRLIHGCEINILNDGTLFLEEQYIEKLDYAIAGIHVQCYEDAGKRKNTDNVISCMQHPKVRLITHPDDDHTPLDYKRLVKAAKLTNTALEVNNSSLVKKDMRLGCYDNYRRMLKLCMEYEAPIIVNSDAHDPSWVGEFSLAEELLKEISFPDSLILNNEQDKLFRFLLS